MSEKKHFADYIFIINHRNTSQFCGFIVYGYCDTILKRIKFIDSI